MCVLSISFCRLEIFDIEHRCFLTFDSDYLTLPVPNNHYQIIYAPKNNNTGMSLNNHCVLCTLPSDCDITDM